MAQEPQRLAMEGAEAKTSVGAEARLWILGGGIILGGALGMVGEVVSGSPYITIIGLLGGFSLGLSIVIRLLIDEQQQLLEDNAKLRKQRDALYQITRSFRVG